MTRTCYTKIMNLFSPKILVQPFTGHVFFFFFFFLFFLLFFFFFFFLFYFSFNHFLLSLYLFPLLFLTFSYIFFFLVSILFFYFDILGYLFISLFTLPSVADIAGNGVLAFTHNLTTCNALIRHFELSQRVFKDE